MLTGLVVLLGAPRLAAWCRETGDRHAAAPPSGRFVRAGDVELFVQEAGPPDGPAVILVHGTGAWSEIWRDAMTALAAAGVRAVAVDLPPFGFSGRPADGRYDEARQGRRLVALIDALGLERASFVGHSFGARATMAAVFQAPDRVRSLVLVDAALGLASDTTPKPAPNASPNRGSGAPPWPVGAVLGAPPLRDALVAATLTNPWFTRRLLQTLIADDAAATDARVAMLQRPLGLRGATSALGEWLPQFLAPDALPAAARRAPYARLRMPVLVIWGARDDLTPLAQGRDLAALIPDARLAVLPEAGHIPAVERPAAFDAALVGFLAGGGPGAR